jgi:uncharacterized protein YggE
MPGHVRLATLLAIALLGGALLPGCQTKVVTAPESEQLGTVTASGQGTVAATPDQAQMSFGVTRQDENAEAALEAASKVADDITAAVKKAGVADEDIQTQSVNVFPLTTDSGGKITITGYQASLSVSVTVRDLGTLGEIITAATGAGADTINGPSFTIDQDAEYREDAIQRAVEDARRSAEAMASAAGKQVGEVLRLSASDVFAQPLPFAAAESRAADAAAVPIEPGTLDVSANVTVVFELK